MMKNLTNGWQKAVLLSIVFICATVLILASKEAASLGSAFFALATLVVYSVFHVPMPPQNGGQP